MENVTVALELPAIVVDLLADADVQRLAPRLATPAPTEWLTAAQAAERMNSPRARVYELIEAGKLPAGREGRAVRIRGVDVDAYLLGRPVPAEEEAAA